MSGIQSSPAASPPERDVSATVAVPLALAATSGSGHGHGHGQQAGGRVPSDQSITGATSVARRRTDADMPVSEHAWSPQGLRVDTSSESIDVPVPVPAAPPSLTFAAFDSDRAAAVPAVATTRNQHDPQLPFSATPLHAHLAALADASGREADRLRFGAPGISGLFDAPSPGGLLYLRTPRGLTNFASPAGSLNRNNGHPPGNDPW
jgi:hypothetical protein